jgi:hypothetical protein
LSRYTGTGSFSLMVRESHPTAFCRITTTDALMMSYINPTTTRYPTGFWSFYAPEMPRVVYRSFGNYLEVLHDHQPTSHSFHCEHGPATVRTALQPSPRQGSDHSTTFPITAWPIGVIVRQQHHLFTLLPLTFPHQSVPCVYLQCFTLITGHKTY